MSAPGCSLVGFGSHLTPREPFVLGRLANGDVVVVHHGAEPKPKVRLSRASGRMQFALGPGTPGITDVLLDYGPIEGATSSDWTLVLARGYALPWPEGLEVWSTPPETSWPLEFTRPGRPVDEILYVQGPYHAADVPGPDELRGSDMELVAQTQHRGRHGAVELVEFRYGLMPEGDAETPPSGVTPGHSEEWRQWRIYVPLGDSMSLLVTAQAAADGRDPMRDAALAVATSLQARWI